MDRDPLNVELESLRGFRQFVTDKAVEVDRVLRNDDVSTEVKFYYFGLFMSELARLAKSHDG